MTKNSGLASSQTLIAGAVALAVAALAAAFGLGLFETEETASGPQSSEVQTSSDPVANQSTAPEAADETAAVETAPVTAADDAAEPEVPEAQQAAVEPMAQTDTQSSEKVASTPVEAEQPEQVAEAPAAAGDTATGAESEPEQAAEAQVETPAVDQPVPPRFDIVRIEADGSALIAGVASDGDLVEIVLDRDAIASSEPGPDCKFAAFVTVEPSEQPRLMSLLMHVGDLRIASEDQVIIAPVKPVLTVEAAPAETQPEAEPQVAAAEVATEQAPQAGQQVPEAPEKADETAGKADAAMSEKTEAEPVETAVAEAGATAPEPVVTAEAAAPVATEEQTTAAEPVTTEPAAPAVLLAGKEGVTVLQPAQTGVAQSELVLDVISYTDTGAVELAGRGAGGQTVRAYLNNKSWAEAPISENGQWKTQLTDVAPGIYTLRIDQIEAAGKVTSRVETPFKREAQEKIAIADAAQEQGTGQKVAPNDYFLVQPGNTLWAIAREHYGEGILYVRVFEANRGLIRDPDLIYPGQVFEIPRD
ncbi:MAG: LysM peptidoglycan-binding domain-containing protein [Thalassovita sp.]|nr:LysM peptidoglycan-binding domain-containing protein [Thalassovita sp.]